MKVCDLLLPFGNWNEELIKYIFLDNDVDIICFMPTSKAGVEDKLIWNYIRFGRAILLEVVIMLLNRFGYRLGRGKALWALANNCWARNIWFPEQN